MQKLVSGSLWIFFSNVFLFKRGSLSDPCRKRFALDFNFFSQSIDGLAIFSFNLAPGGLQRMRIDYAVLVPRCRGTSRCESVEDALDCMNSCLTIGFSCIFHRAKAECGATEMEISLLRAADLCR